MDEARIREIVREEIDAANVLRAAPPMTPDQMFSPEVKRALVDQIAEFVRAGGEVVFK